MWRIKHQDESKVFAKIERTHDENDDRYEKREDTTLQWNWSQGRRSQKVQALGTFDDLLASTFHPHLSASSFSNSGGISPLILASSNCFIYSSTDIEASFCRRRFQASRRIACRSGGMFLGIKSSIELTLLVYGLVWLYHREENASREKIYQNPRAAFHGKKRRWKEKIKWLITKGNKQKNKGSSSRVGTAHHKAEKFTLTN